MGPVRTWQSMHSMFVPEDFVRRRFAALIRAKMCMCTGILVYLRDETTQTKSLGTNMPTNFERKRLKPRLDIIEKPKNRVHRLADSNVSLSRSVALN